MPADYKHCYWLIFTDLPVESIYRARLYRQETMIYLFVTPLLGWVATSSGQIFRTTDGGITWIKQLQTKKYFRSLKFADELNGWAGTLNQDSLLFHTTNGGNIWTLVDNLPNSPVAPHKLCGLSVVSKDVVYGSGGYNGQPVVIKTTNGGTSWQAIDMSRFATTLVDCYFVNKDSGFVVGGSPNALFNAKSGTTKIVILFTSDGGSSWVTR